MVKRLFLGFFIIVNFAQAANYKSFDVYTNGFKTIKKTEEKQKIYNLTKLVETEFKIKKELMWALIATESSFKNVTNGVSIGYTQIQLGTAKDIYKKYEQQLKSLGVKPPKTINDLKNPKTQILISGAYLRYLIDKFKDQNIALRAYNAGPAGFVKAKNSWYSKRIIDNLNKIKSLK